MDDEVNQKISQFIDDEITIDEALDLLDKVQLQPELQQTISRYQMTSNILSGGQEIFLKSDFLTNVQQGIAKEPVYLLPVKSHTRASTQTIVAIAASIALMTVLATRLDHKPASMKLNTLSASTVSVISSPPVSMAENKKSVYDKSLEQQEIQQNNRFNDYLQAHNTSLYTNGTAYFQRVNYNRQEQ